MSQVHSQFKVFISTPVDSKLDPAVADDVRKFFTDNGDKYDAKSVGIEYLEDEDKLVLSIGYVELTNPLRASVKLNCVSLGQLELNAEVIQAAMADAASKVKDVICHEFYVNDGEFFMVLLSLVE